MTDCAAIYESCRNNITDLVSALDDEAASHVVPATPEWSIHDLVAHLTGVLSDILTGNLGGVATDEWTAAQVAARRDHTLAQILEEWDRHATTVAPMIPNFGDGAKTLCFDIYTHEHDLRHSLGKPGNRSGPALDNGVDRALGSLSQRLKDAQLPLRVAGEHREWAFGPDPTVTLEADLFELMRAIPGRRSADQVRAYRWSTDPEPYMAAFFLFGPRADALLE